MSSYNRVILMGNLTRDIEIRHTANNTAVANVGLAVNRKWKNQSGEPQEEVTFVDCTAWGKTAEIMAQYLSKGNPVHIEGYLKLEQWEKDGEKRSKHVVVIEGFQFVNAPGGGGGNTGGGGSPTGGGTTIDSSDIPF